MRRLCSNNLINFVDKDDAHILSERHGATREFLVVKKLIQFFFIEEFTRLGDSYASFCATISELRTEERVKIKGGIHLARVGKKKLNLRTTTASSIDFKKLLFETLRLQSLFRSQIKAIKFLARFRFTLFSFFKTLPLILFNLLRGLRRRLLTLGFRLFTLFRGGFGLTCGS